MAQTKYTLEEPKDVAERIERGIDCHGLLFFA